MKIKSILISQPKPTSEKSPYYEIAKKHNVKIDFRPFIKVEPVLAKEFRKQKISILEHTAVVFTSRTAIDHFFRLCEELRISVPEPMKYFCISEAIALYLQKYIVYRKRKVFFGNNGKLDEFLPLLLKHQKENFLLSLSSIHKDELTDLLDKNNLKYTRAIMYKTVSNDFTSEEEFDYDVLVFFSPAGVASLLKNFPNFKQDKIAIGTLGPATAKSVTELGLRLDFEAPRPDAPSITAALDIFIEGNHKSYKK